MTLVKGALSRAFTYIEPGPVILLTARQENKDYMMTLSWSMVLDFTPRICIATGPWNETFNAILHSRECCLCIPPVALMETVVGGVGMTHSSEGDKFVRFGLHRQQAEQVSAPLITDCQACLECRLEHLVEGEDMMVLRGLQLWENPDLREAHTFHAVGDGHFIKDGTLYDLRKAMWEKIPQGSERIPSLPARSERYTVLLAQVRGLIEDTPDPVSVFANITAAIRENLPEFFWVGFYRVRGDTLYLGPFQGSVACTRIPKGKGVCGTAWAENRTLIVPDVTQFPGHIACSSLSRSEIVVPVRQQGQVTAVLDIDSTQPGAFSKEDQDYLEQLVGMIRDPKQALSR